MLKKIQSQVYIVTAKSNYRAELGYFNMQWGFFHVTLTFGSCW